MNIRPEELFSLRLNHNWVLLKALDKNDTMKVGKKDIFLDTTYKPEFHQRVINEVVSVPRKLVFNRSIPCGDSMEWKTIMELKVGDKVWINYLAAIRANKVNVGDDEYLFVNYSDIYLKLTDEGIKMLNGYVLCEPVYAMKKSSIERITLLKDDSMQGLARNCKYGKVRYIGKPITEYYYEELCPDDDYVRVGDTVMFTTEHQIRLEHGYHQHMDGKEYVVSRRNRMECIVKFDEELVEIEK